jgi:Fe-S cluster assembly iron-binding protein IscA
VKQKKDDKVYNVDGIEIIVTAEVDKTLLGAKIDFGGLFTKDFIVTPRYS